MERPISPLGFLTGAVAFGSLLAGAYMFDTATSSEMKRPIENPPFLDLNTSLLPVEDLRLENTDSKK